ncbi:hypothetical protein B566_EDAN008208 [Ephemera danica]|nr:hypothetical protein B566_EDAN008208 [Ephemera danica]
MLVVWTMRPGLPALLALLTLLLLACARGAPLDSNGGVLQDPEPDPELVLQMLARLGQSILRAHELENSSKRGLDLGLSRGFSGSQAAKHLMGLAAATYAGGPGRRRREAPETPVHPA